ncbi:hypothetical protein IMSAG049_01402 [Clostridiales bacterium]|nr:hypothetical protein IMSAG049_01402 [Clostridiales bacterium]
MQTQNIKVIRTKDNRLFVFYYSGGAVFCRQLQKGTQTQPLRIIENVSPLFSLWCSDSGIYLLANGAQGVTLCYYNYSRWAFRLISNGSEYSNISFFTIGESVHILYSLKAEPGEALYVRSMNKENWSQPYKIADIMPFGSSSYFVGHESDETIRIYYRTADKTVKYCSLSLRSGSLGASENLLTTNMPCSDISILTMGNECHILYLAQSMYSSQLIYKGIRPGQQSKARIIWEGQLSGSCALFHCGGRLYALIYNDTKSYVMYSSSGGAAFSSAKNLGVRIGGVCAKAEYLDFFCSDSFRSDEIIIDTSNFFFPVIPELYPAFIPERTAEAPKPVSAEVQEADVSLKAAEYEEQLSAMNGQIGELSKTLAQRNEEIAAVSARWRMKYESLAKENEMLKAQIAAKNTPAENPSPAPPASQEPADVSQ